MRKYDEQYQAINTLLSHLRAFKAVILVNNYYLSFGNDAPGILLQQAMDNLQEFLDNSEQE